MAFRATPINVTELLVIALAIVAIIALVRKQYDSNIPLLFYLLAVVFTNWTERPVDPYLMYGSMAFVLLLRFEFLNSSFTKFFAFLATIGLIGVAYVMMTDVMV